MPYEPTQIDWAQLAAYIDGEGCIAVYSIASKQGFTVYNFNVSIGNADPRLIMWLKDTFGGSTRSNTSKGNKNWRTSFEWKIANKGAEKVLRSCLPYLKIKKEQADVALAFRATIDVDHKNQSRGKRVSKELINTRNSYVDQMKALKKAEFAPTYLESPEAPLVLTVERTV